MTITLGPVTIPVLITCFIWAVVILHDYFREPKYGVLVLLDIGWEIAGLVLTLITWLIYFAVK